jgi:hypothetical protein
LVSFAFEGDAKLLFAEASMKLPGIVEDVDERSAQIAVKAPIA